MDLSEFWRWVTVTQTQCWHSHRRTAAKSFPVQDDDHFLTVCRYVERNPLRAGLVKRAEDWRWSSLPLRRLDDAILDAGPVAWPGEWEDWVNLPQTDAELEALRRSLRRGSPFGSAAWTERTARRLGLESTLRPRGRPKKLG